jgi:hypothetical protein
LFKSQEKTANAQFDTSVQLLLSQPPMQMSDCLKSTQQLPTTNSSCNTTTVRMQKTEASTVASHLFVFEWWIFFISSLIFSTPCPLKRKSFPYFLVKNGTWYTRQCGRHWRGLTMKSFWEMFLQNYALWSIMITMIILFIFEFISFRDVL